MPRGEAPRQLLRQIKFGGVCWKKSELILNKIPTDCRPAGGRTKTECSGGQKGRGLGGRNFCPPSLSPPLFSPPQFFVPTKLARRPNLFYRIKQFVIIISHCIFIRRFIQNIFFVF